MNDRKWREGGRNIALERSDPDEEEPRTVPAVVLADEDGHLIRHDPDAMQRIAAALEEIVFHCRVITGEEYTP